jgi:HEAT repeat protein
MHWWTLQQLRSKKPLTRLQAVTKLAGEANERALDVLAHVVKEDPDSNVRKGALQASTSIRSARTLDVVSSGLRDADAEVRETAVRTLLASGDARAIGLLLPALEDPSAKVRWHAAKALDALGWKSTTDTEQLHRSLALGEFHKLGAMGAAAIAPLMTALKDSDNPNRRLVVEALSQTGDARAVQPIIDALKDKEPHVRVAAVEALGRMKEPRAVDGLTKALRDQDHLVRAAAANALGKIGGATAALLPLLKDAQWGVRQATVEALARMREIEAVPSLLPLLKDKDKDVRCATAEALGQMRDERALQTLIECLADAQSDVRSACAAAVHAIDPGWAQSEAAHRALPALKASAQSREYWVRQSATEVLARIDQTATAPTVPTEAAAVDVSDTAHFRRKTAADLLFSLLDDADRDLRLAAAEALGRLSDPRAVPLLQRVLHDPDPWVRSAARESLTALGVGPAGAAS